MNITFKRLDYFNYCKNTHKYKTIDFIESKNAINISFANDYINNIKKMPIYRNDEINIWGIKEIDPIIYGNKSLYSNNDSNLGNDIITMEISNAIFIKTINKKKSGIIDRAIIKISSNDLYIYGNVKYIIEKIELVKKMSNRFSKVEELENDCLYLKNICEETIMGSEMLNGAFGAIYLLVWGYWNGSIDKNSLPMYCAMLLFFNLLGIGHYLFISGFGSRIISFQKHWTIKYEMLSWVIFLLILIVNLMFIVNIKDISIFIIITNSILTLILLIIQFISLLGKKFYNNGYSKNIAITVVVICIIGIVLFIQYSIE